MFSTKLSKFCDGVLEAGWLSVLAIAPLFFDTYSSRVFEPDKISIVRTIAVIMAAAWLLKLFEEGGIRNEVVEIHPRHRWLSFTRVPLALPLIIYLSTYLLSSILSLTPRFSFLGSYTRMQGAYSTAAYVVIFAAIAVNVRRKAQVERIITTIIITSLPVSLYGIMQRWQLDPLPWGEDTVTRVTSTLGNAIFVAAYLIMAFPFTLMRVIQSFRAADNDKEHRGDHVVRAVAFTFICATQLLTLWYSGSRGPWLGLLAGMFFWAVLLTLAFKKRKFTLAALGVAGAIGAFLIVFNIPNGPLETLRQAPTIGRLGRVFDTQDGTSRVRELIWGGAVKMILPHDPHVFPDGSVDTLVALRPFIGHGPESIHAAYTPFYDPELAHFEKRTATPDRAHNETFDSLITTGVIGAVAYLTLFAAIIYYGLKWLGAIKPQDKWLYIALYVIGGIVGASVMVAWRGLIYFGVGLPFGMLIGLLIYLTFVAVRRTLDDLDEWRIFILVSIVAAIVAHFTEIHFGIAIVSTRLHFWAISGLMIAVGWAMPRKAAGGVAALPAGAGIKLKPPRPRPLNQLPQGSVGNIFASLFPALIIGVILATVGYDLIANTRQYNSVWRILATSLLTIYGQSGISYGTLWLFFLTAIIPSLAWTDEQKSPWLTLGGSMLVWLTFTLFHLGALSSLAMYQSASDIDRAVLVEAIGGLYLRFAVWIMILLGLLAITLVPDWPIEASRTTAQIVIAPLVFAVAIGGAVFSNVFIIQADIAHKLGTSLERQGAWPIVIALYDQAVKLAPQEDQYYLYLGRAYLSAANASTDRAQRETMLGISLSKLQEAQKINPLNPDHTANLARLTRTWSTLATDTKTAASRIDQANSYYEISLKLGPAYPTLWNEAAVFDFLLRKNPSAAIAKLEKSLKLDPEFDETYLTLAEISRQAAFNEKDSATQRAIYQKSVEAYRGLIALEAGDGRSARLFTAYVGLGYTYSLMGDVDHAIAAYKDSLSAAPKEQTLWEVYRAIAESYLKKQDKANALSYANQALAAAPANEKPTLQALVNGLAK